MIMMFSCNKRVLYPIEWNGKIWDEKDCDPVFVSFYNSPYALAYDGAVRIDSSMVVYPDGTMEED